MLSDANTTTGNDLPTASAAEAAPLLAVRGATKRFPGVVALEDVSLEFYGGRVHCLLGENGAGKSTLIRILSGAYRPDAGVILRDGGEVDIHSPGIASELGVVTIHQSPMVVPTLTVGENLILGSEPTQYGIYRPRLAHKWAESMLEKINHPLPLDAPARDLPFADRQLLSIARALGHDGRIFIMDEATEGLNADERDHLFEVIGELKRSGCAVLFVTHRLDEAQDIGDDLTVLRDGRVVDSVEWGATTIPMLIEMISGQSIAEQEDTPRRPAEAGPAVVDATCQWEDTKQLRDPARILLRRGEVLGLIGLVGAGQEEVARVFAGDSPNATVTGTIRGRQLSGRLDPRAARRLDIAYLPADRARRGLYPRLSAISNVSISSLHDLGSWLWISARRERGVWRFAEQLKVRPSAPDRLVGFFSGGNQQKLLVARALAEQAELFVMEDPTAALDVGTRIEVRSTIRALASEGRSFIISSSDPDEALDTCDRLLVFRAGRVVAEVAAGDANARSTVFSMMVAPAG